jgi:SAM-dependent methyltransferase
MPDEDKLRHSRSFDDAVQLYERARPSYPAEAVGWMVPAGARDVLDLAAGTGKLTRVLVAAGYSVTAVEPLDGMRAELSRQLPDVPALAGTAEQIPAADGSADALLVAQAWHWFDESRSVPEVARVLRPGGALGLVWNDMDVSVPWVARMRATTREAMTASRYGIEVGNREEDRAWSPPLGSAFGAPEWATFRHVLRQDLDTLLDNLGSRSYFITLAPPEREAILASVADRLRSDPDTAGRDSYDLPYVARCMRAVRQP